MQGAEDTEIEEKYSFQTSSSITFCPSFFDDNKFPTIDVIIGNHDSQQLTLDQVDCAERIMLHEYMHLAWVKDLVPVGEDYIGYLKVAENAKNNQAWDPIANLPDAYAWYALYSYFNNAEGGCARDAWPAGQDKFVIVN